jgi:hypothetical protein
MCQGHCNTYCNRLCQGHCNICCNTNIVINSYFTCNISKVILQLLVPRVRVHHIIYAPKFITANNIEKRHPQLAKKSQETAGWEGNLSWNCCYLRFSKAKRNAAYNHHTTTTIIFVVKCGKMPNNSKCEAFLTRRGSLETIQLAMLVYLKESCPNGSLWNLFMLMWNDGGKGAFWVVQTMVARHGIVCKDCWKVTMHRKDISNGDGFAVSDMVKNNLWQP